MNGGALPCVRLVCATPAIAWQTNLTYLPNTTSWMQKSMCWIGQESLLAGDIQRQWGQQAGGKLQCRLNQNTYEWPLFKVIPQK